MTDHDVSTSIDAILGLILSNIRKQKKISQETSAEFIGITKQAISNMENGRSKFAVVQIYQLCALYETEPRKIFEALDEALQTKNINIFGINKTVISAKSCLGASTTTNVACASSITSSNLVDGSAAFVAATTGVSLVSPIVAGVTLAGFLGAKFMKKLTEISKNENNDKAS